MIATGSTIVKACELLNEKGAEDIFVFATHPVFSKNAPELLQNCLAKNIFTTDSIDIPQNKKFSKLHIISISKIIANAIGDIM